MVEQVVWWGLGGRYVRVGKDLELHFKMTHEICKAAFQVVHGLARNPVSIINFN